MKFILTTMLILVAIGLDAQSISSWPLNFKTVDGYNMTSDLFKSRTILISTFDASSPNIQVLKMLDSFQRIYYKSVFVIAIPINDFGTAIPGKNLIHLFNDTLKLCFPIAQISRGKPGANQNAIWKWATDSTRSYFRIKMAMPNQTLMINGDGIPYVYFQENEDLTIEKIKQFLPSN
jgi:hypothetical protein